MSPNYYDRALLPGYAFQHAISRAPHLTARGLQTWYGTVILRRLGCAIYCLSDEYGSWAAACVGMLALKGRLLSINGIDSGVNSVLVESARGSQ